MAKYKAAVIGCGMIAGRSEKLESPSLYSHGKAYVVSGCFSEVAFFDRDSVRSEALALRFGGRALAGELGQALRAACPDVVSVCTPDETHFEVIKSILENPGSVRVVFAEKPVCRTVQELDALRRLELASGVPVVVNHTRRFDLAHQRLAVAIKTGRFGALKRARADYYGGWRHIAVHAADLLHFFFSGSGQNPISLSEARFRCASRFSDDPGLDARGTLAGAPLDLLAADEGCYQLFEVALHFERGVVKLEDFGADIRVFRADTNAEGERVLTLDRELSGPGLEKPIARALEVLVRYLETRDKNALSPYGLEQAAMTMQTLWDGLSLYERSKTV